MIFPAPGANDASGVPSTDPPRLDFLRRHGLADLLPRFLSATVLMVAALLSLWLGDLVFDLIWLFAALAVERSFGLAGFIAAARAAWCITNSWWWILIRMIRWP